MIKLSAGLLSVALVLAPFVSAQSPEWGQCGGIGWNGATTCVSGTTCTFVNDYYSQCIAGGSGGSSTTTATNPGSTAATGLNAAAKAAGKKYFGSATDNGELSDSTYTKLLADTTQFGQITPGNSMKWDATEPNRGQFTFTNGDKIANLAKTNGQLLRGHTTLWHNQLPGWVSNGGFSASELTSIIQNHVSTVIGHYKGQIYSWDVMNEIFNDDGTLRSSVFSNTLGNTFPAIALKAARAADPNAKLYINDYNIDGTGAKSTAMVNLVKSLKSSGVPIDGIGVQAHLISGQIPSTFQANLQQFANLGVEVALTELDIRITLPVTDAKLAQQKKDYQTVIAACKNVTGCIGVTIWDYTDKYSWVPGVFPGEGAALPWDGNFAKKPAYDGIVAGFA
jgi:endo-1,4-beta-xylanase